MRLANKSKESDPGKVTSQLAHSLSHRTVNRGERRIADTAGRGANRLSVATAKQHIEHVKALIAFTEQALEFQLIG